MNSEIKPSFSLIMLHGNISKIDPIKYLINLNFIKEDYRYDNSVLVPVQNQKENQQLPRHSHLGN